MPRKVDHRERRTRIADALIRVAASRGLEAVSLRHVATEAGVSTGMVQHYFRTKDEMMTFALDVVGENVQDRLAIDAACLGADPPPRATVRALMLQLLPLDETRLLEGHVGLAFYAYAAVRPAISTALRENVEQMRGFVADLIRRAQAAGDADAAADPVVAATSLFALVEGLAVQVLVGHYAAELAVAVFEAHLDTVFGRSAGHPSAG